VSARAVAGRLCPLAGFAVVLAGGTLAGRLSDGALSVALPVLVVVLALAVLLVFLVGRADPQGDLDYSDDCGWCGGPIAADEDFCSEYCREAEDRDYQAQFRRAMSGGQS
jgi:hypothetical protein